MNKAATHAANPSTARRARPKRGFIPSAQFRTWRRNGEPADTEMTEPAHEPSTASSVVRGFIEASRKADGQLIEIVRRSVNADISGHSPEDLRVLDDILDEYFQQALKGKGGIEGGELLVGCYLGEVFVRNLGARWQYPSGSQVLRIVLSWNRSRTGKRFWYLWLGEQKVNVFGAAHEAVEKTGVVFPLYGFYQQWAKAAAGGTPVARVDE